MATDTSKELDLLQLPSDQDASGRDMGAIWATTKLPSLPP